MRHRDIAGQIKASKARAKNAGPEERFGFYGHTDTPASRRSAKNF
jgi:hypothetical protein